MDEDRDLTDREFVGLILPDKDPSNQGAYKVHVTEIQPHMTEKDGIWAKNHVCKNRVSPSENGVCGSYYPLQPGTAVIVKFFDNQIESAYIDRVVSDSYPQSLPFQSIDRDNFYQILRTPKYNNLIAIYEGSSDFPENSIHVYYNATQTVITIDQTGINIKTLNNTNVTVTENCNITVNGNTNIKTTGTANIEAATVNVKGVVNIGPTVNLGITPSSATAADAPTLIDTSKDYAYFKKSKGN